MEIRIQSLKFDADQKLLDFVEKKVSKIGKFDDQISGGGSFPSGEAGQQGRQADCTYPGRLSGYREECEDV